MAASETGGEAKKDGPPQTTFHLDAALRCRQQASGKEVGEGGFDVVGNISTGWAAIDASHGIRVRFSPEQPSSSVAER